MNIPNIIEKALKIIITKMKNLIAVLLNLELLLLFGTFSFLDKFGL